MLTESEKQALDEMSRSSRGDDVFGGDIYTDKSKLRHVSLQPVGTNNIIDRLKRSTSSIIGSKVLKKLNPHFIVGYYIEGSPILYEVWYAPQTKKVDNYAIVSNTGIVVSNHDSIQRAMAELLNLVSKVNEDVFVTDSAKALLEQTITSREALIDAFNSLLTQYNTTRIKRHLVTNKMLRTVGLDIAGVDLIYPTSYKSGVFNRIMGNKTQLEFITGFNYANFLDIEIWQVEKNNRSRFMVFNLNNGSVVADNLNTIREAYMTINEYIRAQKPQSGRYNY